MSNILSRTLAEPKRQPSAGPAPATPTPTRVNFEDMQPKTPGQEFAAALAEAGWAFDVSAVVLVNSRSRKTAKLESLPFALVDFLASRKHFPGAERLAQLVETLQADVLKALPRVGGLLQ